MADPFESLRHDAVSTGSTVIDPRFRAEVLAEARRRLTSSASSDSIRPRVSADTPTHTPMEPITMLAKNPKKTRTLLLAAACVALVATGTVAVLALERDNDKAPAPADTVRSTATITSDAQEPNPTSPATTVQGVPEPTTISPTIPPDQEIAREMLLPTDQYASGWFSASSPELVNFDPEVAGDIEECRPFMTSVFDSVEATPHDVRVWQHAAPPALFAQYVLVLPDVDAARTLFATLNGAEFSPCSAAYLSAGPFLPSFFHEPVVEPPDGAVGDDIVFRRYPFTGTDELGQVYEEIDLDASIRVGRALIFIGTVNSSNSEEVVSEDEFHDVLGRVVERAASALNIPVPESSTASAPPPTNGQIASAALLNADEYAPDWTIVSNRALGASMHSGVAASKPECAPFLDSVFAATEQGSSLSRAFFHAAPKALFTQFTAVYPDVATAGSVYAIINSSEFAPCATAYNAGQTASVFPSPVDQPISDSPFGTIGDELTYRTFSETWHDSDGAHGPQTDLDAVMLVGPTITFIGTVTDGEGGAVLNTVDQFASALQRVVERTNAALAGQSVAG